MHSMGIDAADTQRGGQFGGLRVNRHAEDVLTVHNELERGAPFCSNPSCDLHVRLTDPQVEERRKLGFPA